MHDIKQIDWVQLPSHLQSGYIVQDFEVVSLKKTSILVCGLGFFKLYINGRLVTKELNNPVWSDYEERKLDSKLCSAHNDKFSHRFYYRKYDISRFVRLGINRIGIILANGWYRETMQLNEGLMGYGEFLKCGYIIYDDNNKLTSTSDNCYCKQNHIIFNNIFYGEKHDYKYEDKNWLKVGYFNGFSLMEKCKAPLSKACLQLCPCDKEVETIKPKLVVEYGDKKIYDAGVNISGYAVIMPKSRHVKVTYTETLTDDKKMDYTHAGGEGMIQTTEYSNIKNKGLLKPLFSIYGFRFVEVTGGDVVSVKVVHSDVKVKAHFKCNNAVLQWEYDAYIRTQLSNMHSGVPSDCPHRERLGYTGDGQLTAKAAMMSLEAKSFYDKWIDDILDCQDSVTGHVQHTAPFYGGGGGAGGWGSAIVIVPYTYYQVYGDKSMLEKTFDAMLKYTNSMDSFSKDGIVVRELEGGWNLGEWITPYKLQIPSELVNTYYYAYSLKLMIDICDILSREQDREILKAKQGKVLEALKDRYVLNGRPNITVQGADCFLYDLGLLDKEYIDIIEERYNESEHFDTGIFGTDVLLKILFENGKFLTAYKLLTQTTFPSFGYEMVNGATTFWEGWTGECSMNHPMFGGCIKYLYKYFAGINILGKDGNKTIIDLQPKLCIDMLPLSIKYTTDSGYIDVSYTLDNGRVRADIKKRNVVLKNSTNYYELSF